MNIQSQKAASIQTTLTQWNGNHVGDEVWVKDETSRADQRGTITAISQVPPSGDYPTFTVDVPALGEVTRPADEVVRRITVKLYIDMAACGTPTDMAKEIADGVPSYYPVVDWETQEG